MVGGHAHMQIDGDFIGRPTAADAVIALHTGHRGDDPPDLFSVERGAIHQRGHIFADGVHTDLGDHDRHDQRYQRVGPYIPQPDQNQPDQDRRADADAGQGMAGVGDQYFAVQAPALAHFP